MASELPRPFCCPDPKCEPVFQLYDDEADGISPDTPGQSWSCFGKMPAPVAFTYDGVEHKNDLNECHYTPLKGIVKMQANATDWQWAAFAYQRAYHNLRTGERCTAREAYRASLFARGKEGGADGE